jgi:hypothetical protein
MLQDSMVAKKILSLRWARVLYHLGKTKGITMKAIDSGLAVTPAPQHIEENRKVKPLKVLTGALILALAGSVERVIHYQGIGSSNYQSLTRASPCDLTTYQQVQFGFLTSGQNLTANREKAERFIQEGTLLKESLNFSTSTSLEEAYQSILEKEVIAKVKPDLTHYAIRSIYDHAIHQGKLLRKQLIKEGADSCEIAMASSAFREKTRDVLRQSSPGRGEENLLEVRDLAVHGTRNVGHLDFQLGKTAAKLGKSAPKEEICEEVLQSAERSNARVSWMAKLSLPVQVACNLYDRFFG